MRLLERLSLEVQLSFTVSTRTSPLPSYGKLLSWVFLRPFSASSIGDPRSSRLPVQTPQHLFRLGFRQKLPNLPATVPLTGFLNLSAASFSPTPSHHFQAGNALGVSPFRGFPFRAAPYGSSPPACPLDVSPSVSASVLSGSFLGHVPRLRSSGHAIRRLQGLRPREN